MAISSNNNVSWSSFQTEFGGINPIGMSEYRRVNGYVPDLSSNTNVPTSLQNMSASKMRNATRRITYTSGYLPEIDLNNGSAASYFYDPAYGPGGGLQGGGYYTAYSEVSTTFTTSASSYPLRLTVNSFYVTLGNGYRYESDLYGTDYYYDYVRIPGLRVFDSSGNVVGSVDSADTTSYWYGAYTYQVSVFVPSLVMAVQPSTTYTIRYKADWIMGGGGYNVYRRTYLGPYYTITNS